MAPERFSGISINGPSKESDVYSLMMTSFEVCFSAANCLTIWYNHPATIRSSQEYCHMVTAADTRWVTILDAVYDHPVQQTQVRTNGCRTLFGMQSRPAGAIYQNSDMSSRLRTTYFQFMVSGRCSVGDSSLGLPLSSSFCESRSQKLRGALVKWTRQVFPPSPFSSPKAHTNCSASRITRSPIGNDKSCSINFAKCVADIR
jgi:hypothetical protein